MNTPNASYLRLLGRYLGPQRVRVTALAALLGSGIVLPLVNPQLVRAFIDRATSGAPTSVLSRLAVAYIALAGLLQITNLATAYLSELVGWTATNQLRGDLAEHVLELDMPFHNRRTPGEMIERIDGDVTALSQFFSQLVMDMLWAVLTMAGVVVLVGREDWRVGLALAVYSAVALAVYAKLRHAAVPHSTAQREQSALLFGYLEERLQGLDDIRSSGAGHHVVRGFQLHGREKYRAALRSEKAWAGMLWSSTNATFLTGKLLMLGAGAWLHLRGSITIGTVYLLYQYVQTLNQPLETIGDQLREFQTAGAGAGRIAELLAERRVVPEQATGRLGDGALSLRFDNVSFAYTSRSEDVLRDVDALVPAGHVLGVVGRTGSGKTTLARLLLRLWEPHSGRILLGETDVADVPLAQLRARVGYVTQDVQLFGASVRENLTLFGAVDASDDRIVEVLSQLGLESWLARLPDGLDTWLASGGGGLSAGESQLIAFARVFLRDPGVVVLDEASSRLDPATEQLIERAVDRLLAGRTGVLIAHRLRTVRRADEVLVLDHGRVVEFGVREDLAADPASRFAQMLAAGLEELTA